MAVKSHISTTSANFKCVREKTAPCACLYMHTHIQLKAVKMVKIGPKSAVPVPWTLALCSKTVSRLAARCAAASRGGVRRARACWPPGRRGGHRRPQARRSQRSADHGAPTARGARARSFRPSFRPSRAPRTSSGCSRGCHRRRTPASPCTKKAATDHHHPHCHTHVRLHGSKLRPTRRSV